MTVITDSKKRVTLPAKPGVRFDLKAIGEDKYILTRLEPVQPKPAKVTFTKKNGFTVARTDRVVSEAAIKEAIAEFP
jgi:hypothetical protein